MRGDAVHSRLSALVIASSCLLLLPALGCELSIDDEDGDVQTPDTTGENPHEDDPSTEDSGDGESSTESGERSDDPDAGQLAAGIELTGVLINQGASIPLAVDGVEIAVDERNAPLVALRPALVRAVHDVPDDWRAQTIEARLTLEHADGRVEILRSERKIEADADLTRRSSMFEWRLEADQLTTGLRYSLGLFSSGSEGIEVGSGGPRIPISGRAEVGVPADPMVIEIVIVPVAYDGAVPNFSDENVQALEDTLYELNPVQQIIMSVRDDAVEIDSSDLSTCLSAMTSTRAADSPEVHVYYMGLMNGPPSGLANVIGAAKQAAAWRTGCAMMGSDDGEWAGIRSQIAAHELGHNQGSYHSPGCRADRPVDDYPYVSISGRAEIGSRGYSVVSDDTFGPHSYYDVMSYCRPHWVSDYTYNKWAKTVQTLSSWGRAPVLELQTDYHELLWTLDVEGKSTSWISPGQLAPDLRPSDDIQFRFEGVEGQRSVLPGLEYSVSEGRGFVVPMPWSSGSTQSIYAEQDGTSRKLATPSRLRALFDGLR